MSTKTQVGFGIKIRKRLKEVELKQRIKQRCPFCKKLGAKRLSKGIWLCKKCKKKFASGTFYID